MERRTLLRIGVQVATAAALPRALSAQASTPLIPAGYLSDKYIALPDAPSTVVIAGPDEPGERLVVTGRVMDGTKPVPGVSVYAFHADQKGLYEPQGMNRGVDPRLFGAMRSDESGGYRYETVRPGYYGGSDNPSHVHYVVSAPGYRSRLVDLRFEDDPVIVARRKRGIADDDGFEPGKMVVRPVERDARGVWHVTRDLDMIRE
jgi:protocatechuate 3,4-dioxygenase beta subunit